MNKKGKNKKGKVPNPNPSQEGKIEQNEEAGKTGGITKIVTLTGAKNEESEIIRENIQKLEEKSEKVKEERVPEIVSEIITAPVHTKDEETPKKPKRNRGKKKKGKDDDDIEDNFEEKETESSINPTPEETKVNDPELESNTEQLPPITPTARKKKNKKKNAEQKTEGPITTEQDPLDFSTEVPAKESEIQEFVPDAKHEFSKTDTMEQELKPAKKKNKKKKRNDSEKSDREDISCTAAFHKILDDKEEPTQIKMEEKFDDCITSLKSQETAADINLDRNEENLPVQPVIENALTATKDEGETHVTEGKVKKKNKKDKKHIPKPEESIKYEETKNQTDITVTNIELAELISEKKVAGTQKDVAKDTAAIESAVEPSVEEIPKPKPKIAKPVEKKRKGKHESQPTESVIQDISTKEPEDVVSEPMKIEDKYSEIKVETIKNTEQKIASAIESKNIPSEVSGDIIFMATDVPDEEEKLIAQEFELLAEKAMGKKRKKGPKISKALEMSNKPEEPKIESNIEQTDIREEMKAEKLPVITEILTPQPDHLEFTIMSEKSDVAEITDITSEPKDTIKTPEQSEFHGKVLLTPENIFEEKEFSKDEESRTPQVEDKQKTDSKSGKKRKKSPKPSKKTEAVLISGPAIISNTEETATEVKQSLGERIEASNITRMYDIEISSIKADESEGSACDVIPDITYPRASSQQLPDDNNNNTIIREVISLEATTLGTSISQETKKSPSIEIINKGTEGFETIPKEEKTDLKSKMMEVNQDMEELRLSIERSLAELTSIEKSEETIEKEFKATRTQAERVSNILFDAQDISGIQEEPKEETMKMAIEKPLDEAKTTLSLDDNKQHILSEMPQATTICKTPIDEQTKPTVTKDKYKAESPKIINKFEDFMPAFASQPIAPPTRVEEKHLAMQCSETLPCDTKPSVEDKMSVESPAHSVLLSLVGQKEIEMTQTEKKRIEEKPKEQAIETQLDVTPVSPARKDNKGKHKKKKGKQETQIATTTQSIPSTTQSQSTQEVKKEEKTQSKSETKSDSKDKGESKEKGKQQSSSIDSTQQEDTILDAGYEPIENFEDALTSSADDVNKTFEMIVKESQEQSNPKINIIAPDEEKSPVSPPKNLLGHPDIPVRSNRRDYKKEKDKIPNEITAKVKIKDSVEVEKKQSKNTQTINKMKEFSKDYKINDNDEFVYKYSFRKVFLQSSCHVCKKDLSGSRVACCYCNLLFYCSNKHKDEDWPQHQALCFAVSTIGHLKDQKHVYADAKNLAGHDYRLIRMQMIVSCEKMLKRRLVPWEQEALLYPRICAHVPCREWRQSKLSDCQGCGQISYCTDNADHFPKSHSRWCKSYSLYEKLVSYQQTKGRLEPKLPTKVLTEPQQIPEKINEVLASMYKEKIDINDIQYAALTQLATAPLTAAYCHQLYRNKMGAPANGVLNKKSTFTIHVVGAELQFEADALNKWEVFFLHLRPELQELKVVLVNSNLNPSNLPLELLGKIKLCENCRGNKRRVVFSFQDKKTYNDYKSSEDFVVPDIVCAFNPSIQRSSVYNGKDPWPAAINTILKLKVPFIITAYTITELHKDCIRIKECSEAGYNFIAEPKYNTFASVRPDRNFISDDEMPLLFKNYCYAILSG